MASMLMWVKIFLSLTLLSIGQALPLDCTLSALSSRCPPQVITYNDQGALCAKFPIDIQVPLTPPALCSSSGGGAAGPGPLLPDRFTGRTYGLKMSAPSLPPSPMAPSLGAYDTVRQEPLGPGRAPGPSKPQGPNMGIQISPAAAGPFGPGPGPLGPLPIDVQEPVLPASLSGPGGSPFTPPPVKLLPPLSGRLDRIVLPASDLAPATCVEPAPSAAYSNPYWYGCSCPCQY